MESWKKYLFMQEEIKEIKNQYSLLLATGVDDREAEACILSYYFEDFGENSQSEGTLYLVLALIEWEYGRLSSFMLERALYWLSAPAAPFPKEVLCQIGSLLTSPMSAPKKIRQIRPIHCPWKAGDLLAYKISRNPAYESSEYWNKYILLRVVFVQKWPITYIKPEQMYNETMMISVYNWAGDSILDAGLADTLEYLLINPRTPLLPQMPEGIYEKWPSLERIDSIFNSDHLKQSEYTFALDWGTKRAADKLITRIGNDPFFMKQLPFNLSDTTEGLTLGGYTAFEATVINAFKKMRKAD